MFWNRKLKKVQAERDKLRAEMEEWRECAELWDGDYKRLEERFQELRGECEEIRCAKHKAEWELVAEKERCGMAIMALSIVWQEVKKFGMHEKYKEFAEKVEALLEEKQEEV